MIGYHHGTSTNINRLASIFYRHHTFDCKWPTPALDRLFSILPGDGAIELTVHIAHNGSQLTRTIGNFAGDVR